MTGAQSKLTRGIFAGLIAKIPQGLLLFVCSELELLYVNTGVAVRVPSLLGGDWISNVYWIKHVIWGGVFGLLFAVPLLARVPGWLRGMLVGLGHAAGTLLIVNPLFDSNIGFLGLGVGPGFPVIVVVFNLIWGVLAGLTLSLWNRLLPPDSQAKQNNKPAKA